MESNISRNMEEQNEYDTFMILFFKEDCHYVEGFKNDFRNDISFILNRKTNDKLNPEEKLYIDRDFGIEIHFNKAVNNLYSFFHSYFDENMIYLEYIDFSNFDSSSVTDMSSMFNGCDSLKSIDLSNFNTSLVTDMQTLFAECSSLELINLTNFKMSKVISIDSMFYGCISLKSINLINLKTENGIDMSNMFYECT